MNRRQAVQRVALLLGGSVLGAELFIQTGCKSATEEKVAGQFFTTDEISFLDEVAETIIPKTNTPGAKEAQVGAFMDVMVRDCYTKDDQKIFKEGIDKIKKLSKERFNKKFIDLQPEQRTELLTAVDNDQKEYHKNKKDDQPNHYFRMMRELTLLGFFTSEPGATKALRYVAIPGKYEACISYTKGEKAWAL